MTAPEKSKANEVAVPRRTSTKRDASVQGEIFPELPVGPPHVTEGSRAEVRIPESIWGEIPAADEDILEQDPAQEDLFGDSDQDLQPVEVYRRGGGRSVVRAVARRDGSVAETYMDVSDLLDDERDWAAAFDRAWLRGATPPTPPGQRTIRFVDLFCGCGGLSLGVSEACRALGLAAEAVLAADKNTAALDVYSHNFPSARTIADPIESILDSEFGEKPSRAERRLLGEVGNVDLLVGGPPCQGHSNLNNRTRRRDTRNTLYMKMARFAELFRPEHVVIENVVGVNHDKTDEKAFASTWRFLREDLGYFVDGDIVYSHTVGVPQRRPRMLLVASRGVPVKVRGIVKRYRTATRDFMWACADLMDRAPVTAFDRPSTPTGITAKRIAFLHDNGRYDLPDDLRPACHRNGHTYPSVYGRLYPDRPAPTITTGFMTMGQGRFVHPELRRTLTPHEGARLQGFPDWFDFGERSRQDYLTLIGNAVPPKLAYVVALELLR